MKKAKSEIPKSLWEIISSFFNTIVLLVGWLVSKITQKEKTFEILKVLALTKAATGKE